MKIESTLKDGVIKALKALYGAQVKATVDQVQIQLTRKEFSGDYTIVVFPFVSQSKRPPEKTATEIGTYLKKYIPGIADFNVINGFLNLTINNAYWISVLNAAYTTKKYGYKKINDDDKPKTIVVEYSSPNTNKPLHLGHIRNNLLGYSICEILKANAYNVLKVNLINDRGIHICKSMVAWQKWGNCETPESSGLKGDHLVGKYYVLFDKELKKEAIALLDKGIPDDVAIREAPLMKEAQEMLRNWESGDRQVKALWKKMNEWVYAGFEVTYEKLGVDFDKLYYESETYMLGRSLILEAVDNRLIWIQKKEDNSIWADLTKDGLDEKILLRSDGTSVYITQDIGTAVQRYQDTKFDKHIYVVGNEQIYHFNVLTVLLAKLGYKWAKDLMHFSYGMVDLPSGKMKSREGTVVDADDLIDDMVKAAEEKSKELGKIQTLEKEEREHVYKTIALGALKFFILKVDPKKNMLFNPEESIDLNGNTGPSVQYTYTRIQSILRKAEELDIFIPVKLDPEIGINAKEIQLLKMIHKFPEVVEEAGTNYSPALIANFAYELSKEYNQYYHDFMIVKEEDVAIRELRLVLSEMIGRVLKSALKLLGIDVPERM